MTASPNTPGRGRRVVLFANTDWYLYNFRLALAARIRDAGDEPVFVSPPGPYSDRLIEAGFRWRPVRMSRRSLNPLAEAAVVARLAKLLREEQPEIVHSFTIKCAVYGAFAARLAGIRGRIGAVAGLGYVFTSRDWRARLLRPLVTALLALASAGRSSRLVLQNPDDEKLLRDRGLGRADRLRLIMSSGVDCSRFHPPERVRGADQPLRVLLAGRLLWDKGVAEFVEAARLLRAEGRAVSFLLAGTPDEGNPDSVPVERVRQWVNEGLVEWLGHVDAMPELLRSVDLVVLPTRYGEGVPRSLTEAAATGRPIITTDMPGCREVVSDGVEGFLIPIGAAEPLARAVARLDDDPALAARMGAAARRRAVAAFDETLVIGKTLELYDEVAAVA